MIYYIRSCAWTTGCRYWRARPAARTPLGASRVGRSSLRGRVSVARARGLPRSAGGSRRVPTRKAPTGPAGNGASSPAARRRSLCWRRLSAPRTWNGAIRLLRAAVRRRRPGSRCSTPSSGWASAKRRCHASSQGPRVTVGIRTRKGRVIFHRRCHKRIPLSIAQHASRLAPLEPLEPIEPPRCHRNVVALCKSRGRNRN